jgi:hypothetical protein
VETVRDSTAGRGSCPLAGGGGATNGSGTGRSGERERGRDNAGGQAFTGAGVPPTLTYSGNLVFSPAGSDRSMVPYVTGGIGGLTMFTRAVVTPLGVTDTVTFLTGNVGGGLKWFATEHVGLRGDYRLVAVRSSDDSPAFFARDDVRYGHRIYGGIVLTGGR